MSRLREKTTATLLIAVFMISVFAAAMPAMAKKEGTTIQDGVLMYSAGHYLAGESLQTGFDIFGYNYQGYMFKGSYANTYLNKDGFPPYTGNDEAYLSENPEAASKWYWPYRDVGLLMKWNDAWLSNIDRDGDGLLDRHDGYDSYIGSGAWLTNHQWGTYVGDDGEVHRWDYFTKIVAVPQDANLVGGVWYTSDDTEIGSVIWGSFATIQSVYNDPYGGYNGIEYLSPASAGFGYYQP